MYLRMISMNNHYPDNNSINDAEPLGKFCAFGYYDAVDISGVKKLVQNGETSWDHMEEFIGSKLNGSYNSRIIPCLFENENRKKEENFWAFGEKSEDVFFFITMVRLKEMSVKIFIDEINKKHQMFAYYSYEHCECVVVCRNKTYGGGIHEVEKFKKIKDGDGHFLVLKTYTVFAFPESFLKEKTFWDDENDQLVNIRLNANINNTAVATAKVSDSTAEDRINVFAQELKKVLYKEDPLAEEQKYRQYMVLGDDDLLIEADDVMLSRLMPLYANQAILTHNNKVYKDAFLNVETRIIVKKEENDTDGEWKLDCRNHEESEEYTDQQDGQQRNAIKAGGTGFEFIHRMFGKAFKWFEPDK